MIVISNQSGRASIHAALSDMGYVMDKDDPRVETVLSAVKEKCHAGYSFEDANASFELLALRTIGLP